MRNGVWRAPEVRQAEAELMATVPDGTLMHRAATGLASRIGRMLAQTRGAYGASVLMLVGTGGNGGDALYAGAILARRGVAVRAIEVFPGRSHDGGRAALLAAGGRVVDDIPSHVDIAVDAIIGIGGRPGLPERASVLIEQLVGVPMVAVDVPSGVDVDTGAVNGAAVSADITVTFGCRKPALMVGVAAEHAGMIDLVDIGLDPYLPEPYARIPVIGDIARWWPRPHSWDNKYTRGVLGICAGSAAYPGAGELAVAGALAGPAGYIRYAGSAAHYVRARYPEVVTVDRVADAGRVQAWLVGPGMGIDSVADSQLRSALAAPVPMCLDADALSLVANDPSMLIGRRHGTVLTPHDREFARLAGHSIGDDRVGEAVDLAQRLECVVLLKGYRTVIADPSGNVHINSTGDPALATAGSGDVLSGVIGSLLASGLSPTRSAVAGAFLHGLAGRRAARRGPVTASRIADALHGVVAELADVP